MVNKLGNYGELTTHIPYIVRREFLAHLETEYVTPLNEAAKSFNRVSKKPLASELKASLIAQRNETNSAAGDLRAWIEDEFDFWCERIGAHLHKVDHHHGINVIESYFSGSPPFKSLKNKYLSFFA